MNNALEKKIYQNITKKIKKKQKSIHNIVINQRMLKKKQKKCDEKIKKG